MNMTPRIALELLNGCVAGFSFTLDLLSAPASAKKEGARLLGGEGGGINEERLVYLGGGAIPASAGSGRRASAPSPTPAGDYGGGTATAGRTSTLVNSSTTLR
jgi:hypothetical protein